MATLRNKRQLAAIIRENHGEHPRISQARAANVSRIQEDYITEVSEEIEGRVTKKLSQEVNRAESRILGAHSKLDEFLLNPQIWVHSGSVPETSRNWNRENQEPNDDRSQNNPHPEARVSPSHSKQIVARTMPTTAVLFLLAKVRCIILIVILILFSVSFFGQSSVHRTKPTLPLVNYITNVGKVLVEERSTFLVVSQNWLFWTTTPS